MQCQTASLHHCCAGSIILQTRAVLTVLLFLAIGVLADFFGVSSAYGADALQTVKEDGKMTAKETDGTLADTSKRIKPNVILETDMCTDVDDAGAMAVLHALADRGECKILAICYNASHPHGAGAITAINRYYGRGEIPIGAYKGEHPDTTDPSAYCEAVHKEFAPDAMQTKDMPDALIVYRKVLSEAADNSVVIISVGFTQNLSNLILSEPELVKQKVRELVIMGSTWNDGWNLKAHEMESYTQKVIELWPGPIAFSPAGKDVITGQSMKETPEKNPVRAAYKHYYKGKEGRGRSSWDQLAVLYAIRGANGFQVKKSGDCRLYSGWEWKLGTKCMEITPNGLVNMAEVIGELMTAPPAVNKSK